MRNVDGVEAGLPIDAVTRNLDLLTDPSARHRRQDRTIVIDGPALALDLALERRGLRRVRPQHLELDASGHRAVVGHPSLGPQVLARVIGEEAHALAARNVVPKFGDPAAAD